MTHQILPPPSSQTKARLVLSLAALIALAIIVIPVYAGNEPLSLMNEWFLGTDTYMRMVRVQDWWHGASWYESVSARSNWPYGESLHWTRPLDIVLLILAAPFWPFVGFHKALFISGVISSPITAIFAMWALLYGTRFLLSLRGQVLLLLLFAFQPITRFYFLAARPDHHALILLAFTVTLAMLLRYAHDPDEQKNAPAWAGIATAFGIWVSVESLTTELFALVALALPWLMTGDTRWLMGLRRFTVAGALSLAVMLLVEQPPGGWLDSVEFDRLSTVHVVLLALIALGVELMWRTHERTHKNRGARLGAGLAGALGASFVMAALYPDFFKGPFGAAMDPRIDRLWLGKIQELQSLMSTDWTTIIEAVQIVGPTVWLVIWAYKRHQDRHRHARFDETLLILISAGLLFLPLTLFQIRWGAYLGVSVAIAWAALLQHILDWQNGPRLGYVSEDDPGTPVLRVPVFLGVALLHVFVAAIMTTMRPAPPPNDVSACKWRDLQPVLLSDRFGGGKPQTILTHTHQGSEILYRTPHRVVGTPYHRNTQGILDTYNALAHTDETVVREILTRRGVDYIVLCTDSPEEKLFLKIGGDTMIRKLVSQNTPNWLQKMPLPDALQEHFKIYRVKPHQD